MSTQDNTEGRISVSLSTLRAELGQLELRLVDRLNSALASKADRDMQEQLALRMADVTNRVASLEANCIKRDGPTAQLVQRHEQEITTLQSVSNYKKWILAQGVAIAGLSIPVFVVALERI